MARDAAELARLHYRRQQKIVRLTANRTQALWRTLDGSDLTSSWAALVGPRVFATVSAGQTAAAAQADPYLDAVVAAAGADPDVGDRVNAASFAGRAADGRSLEDLLYLPVVTTKQAIAAGRSEVEAMMVGLNQMLKMAASEVADAGRTAVGAGIAGRRTIRGYIRIAAAPCCARCAILGGKEFGWNAGFQRHPRCDCIHMPATLIARGRGGRRGAPALPSNAVTDARSYFNSLSRPEQDRIFTIAGARAIRDGGDINAIVNARRGMYTTASGLRATRESTLRRGEFFRSERRRDVARGTVRPDIGRSYTLTTARLLPEQIYQLAGSRDHAIAMLRRYGYMG